MKIKRILCLLAVLLLILLSVPAIVYVGSSKAAEERSTLENGRNIYVGDIIRLEITAEGISAGELREKFSDFEIMELKEEPERYVITICTFEPGEYKVLLGNKEIVINVESTLDDIPREDIFEGGTQVMEAGVSFHWRILFHISLSIFVLSGGFILLKILKKRKAKMLTPYQIFLRSSGTLAAESESYLVDLTFLFKKYIESTYQCIIIGKTSSEIVDQLKEIRALETILPDIEEWLMECDRLKFTGVKVSREKKQNHYEKLLVLAEKINLIDVQKEGVT